MNPYSSAFEVNKIFSVVVLDSQSRWRDCRQATNQGQAKVHLMFSQPRFQPARSAKMENVEMSL
jgi:hypothetical protein